MKKIVLLVIIVKLLNGNIYCQEIVSPSGIKWYGINQAFELAKKEPRPILVDVYTDWCSWCTFMMKTTFANSGISNYINTYFYAVRFNAETLDTIEFKGVKYFNRRVGRQPVHDLTSVLLEGRFSYPSIVYYDREGNKTIVPGYKESKDIEPILVYYAENVNKTCSIDEFILNYMYSFPLAYEKDHSIFKIDPNLKPDTLGTVKWIVPEKIAELQKKNPKPILLFFYTDWTISSKVMEKTTFGNSNLASKINEQYYPVKINAASQETINLLGKTYMGTGANQPHQITQTILNGNYLMPAIVVFDEAGLQISNLNGYLVKNQLLPLTDYFYDKSYKKYSFQDYLKSYIQGKKATDEKITN